MGKKSVNSEKFNKKILPIMLIMAVPLIMFSQTVVYDTEFTNPYLLLKDSYVDLFNFYKSIALYIFTAMAVLFYFLYTKKRDMELKEDKIKYYIPALVYTLFIILSTIFSIYPKVALFGVYERFEGAFVLICYLIIMIYAFEVIRNETDIKYIMKAFTAMCFVIGIIGFLQGIGLDPFITKFFQAIIGLPVESKVSAYFGNMSYATLYNPNNAGQFSAMTAPVLMSLFFAFRNIKWKIFTAATAILMLSLVLTSGSANAVVGIAPAILLLLVLFIKNIFPTDKKKKIIFLALIGAMVMVIAVTGGKIYKKIINSNTIQNEIASFKPEEDDMYLYDIKVKEDNVQFVTNAGVFNLAYLETGMAMLDENMRPLRFSQNKTNIEFLDEPYSHMLSISITTTNTMTVYIKRAYDRASIDVVFDEEKFLGIRGTGGRIVHEVMENQMPEKLQGYETAFSRRGYLWFVTLSRIDEIIFKGAGPDNFLYWFEQHDIIGKVNLNHKAQILADKPHNIYLQIASQTGLISLFAFLSLVGIYYISTLRKLGFRKKEKFNEILATGIICGVTGFLFSSLFVDSSVGVTTIFYVLLGVGIYLAGEMKVFKSNINS